MTGGHYGAHSGDISLDGEWEWGSEVMFGFTTSEGFFADTWKGYSAGFDVGRFWRGLRHQNLCSDIFIKPNPGSYITQNSRRNPSSLPVTSWTPFSLCIYVCLFLSVCSVHVSLCLSVICMSLSACSMHFSFCLPVQCMSLSVCLFCGILCLFCVYIFLFAQCMPLSACLFNVCLFLSVCSVSVSFCLSVSVSFSLSTRLLLCSSFSNILRWPCAVGRTLKSDYTHFYSVCIKPWFICLPLSFFLFLNLSIWPFISVYILSVRLSLFDFPPLFPSLLIMRTITNIITIVMM